VAPSLVEAAPKRNRARIRRAGSGISTAVGGYVTGNLLISVIAGTVTTLTLLALSVPYAVALGVIVAIFDLVPLVGATAGTVVVAAVALGTRGFAAASIAVVVMIVYQQVENHVLQQLVYHRTVKLSPLAIALSVAAGVELAGVPGALLGIPFAGAQGRIAGSRRLAPRRGRARLGNTTRRASPQDGPPCVAIGKRHGPRVDELEVAAAVSTLWAGISHTAVAGACTVDGCAIRVIDQRRYRCRVGSRRRSCPREQQVTN
jgi:AI-2E family transporter